MYTRRGVAGLIGGSMLLTSGCLDFVLGEGAYSETAEPARASESAADETGYELDTIEEETIEEEFEIAGETRAVEAGNYIATYEKTLEHPILGETETGVFAAVSTPAFEIAGRTLNPISDYDNEELVELLTAEYEQLEVGEEIAVDRMRILGETVDVSKFEGTAQFQGQEVDVYVHVASFQNEADFLIPLGVYPQQLEDEEAENIVRLFESIRHPADV